MTNSIEETTGNEINDAYEKHVEKMIDERCGEN